MRRFALLYPDEVASVLLVDPMRCEEWPPLDPTKQSELDMGSKLIRFAMPIASCGLARLVVTCSFAAQAISPATLLERTGAHERHVLTRIKTEVRKMPREFGPLWPSTGRAQDFMQECAATFQSIPDTVTEMHRAEPIRDIPVTVLTPGNADPLSEDDLGVSADQRIKSSLRNSEHWIHLDEPKLVIDSIRAMVAAVVAETVAAD